MKGSKIVAGLLFVAGVIVGAVTTKIIRASVSHAKEGKEGKEILEVLSKNL